MNKTNSFLGTVKALTKLVAMFVAIVGFGYYFLVTITIGAPYALNQMGLSRDLSILLAVVFPIIGVWLYREFKN